MNSKILLASMTEIEDKYIEDAAPGRKRVFRMPSALTACLCIAVIILFAVSAGISHKGVHNITSDMSVDHALYIAQMIEFNNAYYEVVESKGTRSRYGLPETITADMAGEHIAYLKTENDAAEGIYIISDAKTDIELYTYSPNPCDAVMIIREKEKYSVVLFCNYLTSDGDIKMEIAELYRLYGVNGPEDIAAISLSPVGKDFYSKRVVDRNALNSFYSLMLSLNEYSNSEYQEELFCGKSEAEQQTLSVSMADNMSYLYIQTRHGLKFRMNIYPEHGWMHASLTSYKMSDDLLRWYANNLS